MERLTPPCNVTYLLTRVVNTTSPTQRVVNALWQIQFAFRGFSCRGRTGAVGLGVAFAATATSALG